MVSSSNSKTLKTIKKNMQNTIPISPLSPTFIVYLHPKSKYRIIYSPSNYIIPVHTTHILSKPNHNSNLNLNLNANFNFNVKCNPK